MERPASATQPKHTNIGVVGLGIIGRGIAGHLRRKGFSVFVWNRSPRPVPNFVGSPGELAGLCNYIQIFVSDDDALLQTVEQLSEKLTPRHVIFAHSTVAPDSMRAAADIVERRGARFVEAMRVNASYSGTLAMKLPKMIGRDFAPQFSVKHMLKDVQIASQIALSHYLDLGVTAAARDQLFEQMQWGRGDEDYSAVLRKYLHEPGPGFSEEPQIQEPLEQPDAEESIAASAEAEMENVEPQEAGLVASPESVLGFSGTMNAPAPAATPLRRGFLKQLLSRFSSGEE